MVKESSLEVSQKSLSMTEQEEDDEKFDYNLQQALLQPHSWYHGPITRINAELKVSLCEGAFLVRDCISSPGEFVLTCRSKGQVMHFRLNRCKMKDTEDIEDFGDNLETLEMDNHNDIKITKFMFQFEDEAFESVPQLILFYWKTGKPISSLSGAVILDPVLRDVVGVFEEVSKECSNVDSKSPNVQQDKQVQKYYFGEKEEQSNDTQGECNKMLKSRPPPPPRNPIQMKPNHREIATMDSSKRKETFEYPDSLHNTQSKPSKKEAKQLFSFPEDINLPSPSPTTEEKRIVPSMPPVTDGANHTTYDIPRKNSPQSCLSMEQTRYNDLYDEPRALWAKVESPPTAAGDKVNDKPCPDNDSPNTIYCTEPHLESAPPPDEMSNTDTSYLEHQELTPLLSSDNDSLIFDGSNITPGDPFPRGLKSCESKSSCDKSITEAVPDSLESMFEPCNYETSLFASVLRNKPLDTHALFTCHALLLSKPADLLARELFKINFNLFISSDTKFKGLPKESVGPGLRLSSLICGNRFRLDAMERYLCLRLFLITTVLTARSWTASASILAKWISMADFTLNTYGDYFGFAAIHSALHNKDLENLEKLWLLLEKLHPKEYEILRQLNELGRTLCSPLMPERQMVVPNIIPFLSGCRDLKGLGVFKIVYQELFNDSTYKFEDHVEFVTSALISNLPQFEAIGKNFLTEDRDQEVKNLFETEFHLRLLWGSSNLSLSINEIDCRHAKFEKVIHALARLVKKLS